MDTNVWSELVKPARDEGVVAWTAANSDELVLSSIVLAELRFYVAKQPNGRKKDKANNLLTAIDAGVGSRFVPFDARDAQAYGELMAKLRRTGKPIPAIDGLIAAQAISRGYAVATRNTKHFARADIELIDPWAT